MSRNLVTKLALINMLKHQDIAVICMEKNISEKFRPPIPHFPCLWYFSIYIYLTYRGIIVFTGIASAVGPSCLYVTIT